jgi:hypothetical protein
MDYFKILQTDSQKLSSVDFVKRVRDIVTDWRTFDYTYQDYLNSFNKCVPISTEHL